MPNPTPTTQKGAIKKLNLGCGRDHRKNFLNIDGDSSTKPDLCLQLGSSPLSLYFPANSIEEILAQDVIEHLHRWEATRLLRDAFNILQPGGKLIARLPDAEAIIKAPNVPTLEKLQLLFGGQDIPVDQDAAKNKSRALHPEFFCHRYGWTPRLFHVELQLAGFSPIQIQKAWPNFIATALKPKTTADK